MEHILPMMGDKSNSCGVASKPNGGVSLGLGRRRAAGGSRRQAACLGREVLPNTFKSIWNPSVYNVITMLL